MVLQRHAQLRFRILLKVFQRRIGIHHGIVAIQFVIRRGNPNNNISRRPPLGDRHALPASLS